MHLNPLTRVKVTATCQSNNSNDDIVPAWNAEMVQTTEIVCRQKQIDSLATVDGPAQRRGHNVRFELATICTGSKMDSSRRDSCPPTIKKSRIRAARRNFNVSCDGPRRSMLWLRANLIYCGLTVIYFQIDPEWFFYSLVVFAGFRPSATSLI